MKYYSVAVIMAVALMLGGMAVLPGCITSDETIDVAKVPPPAKAPDSAIYAKPKPAKETVCVALTELFNNNGFEARADQTGGLDGYGDGFIPGEMPKTKDGKVSHTDGKTTVVFAMPDPNRQQMNNIAANGETIKVKAGKYKALYVIGTATNGNMEVNLELKYRSGKKVAALKFTDWCAEPAFGEVAYAKFKQRLIPEGTEDKACCIWMQKIDLDGSSKLKSITLPVNSDVHIFAMTLAP